MKNLILIRGTMGAGKSAVGEALFAMTPDSAYLDGDWCWKFNPFSVTDGKKELVLSNCAHLLNSYLHCPDTANVIFAWVMPRKAIVGELLSRLDLSGINVSLYTLLVGEGTLRKRLSSDVASGKREESVIARSIAYLPAFEEEIGDVKIDTNGKAVRECAEEIAQCITVAERKKG